MNVVVIPEILLLSSLPKATRTPTETVFPMESETPQKSDTPKGCYTPKSSVACQTPKSGRSFKKSTSSSQKKNANQVTPDGLQQLSLERFITIEKVETPKVYENQVIEVSSDSSEDESEANREKRKNTKTLHSATINPASVSRVLFPTTNSNSLAEAAKESVVKEIKTTDVVEGVRTGFKFKEPRSRILIISESSNGVSSNVCMQRQENILKLPETTDMEAEDRPLDFCVAPDLNTSQLPVAGMGLQGNSERVANSCKIIDKGKKQGSDPVLASFEVASDPSGFTNKNTNAFGKTNTIIGSRDDSLDMPSTSNNRSQKVQVVSTEQSLETAIPSPLCDTFEDFTGATECLNTQSSGEIWTPGHQSSSSCFESEDIHSNRTKRPSKKKKQKNSKSCKNIIPKNTAMLQKTSKGTRTAFKDCNTNLPKDIHGGAKKGTTKAECKTGGKSDLAHKEDKSFSAREECDRSAISSEESCANPGFYNEDKCSERTHFGHTFKIKTPSPQYLQGLRSLSHNSIIMDGKGDKGIRKSSFDIIVHNVSTYAQSSCNSLDSTIIFDNNHPNLSDQGNLKGVPLTDSEWDKLPLEYEGTMVSDVKNQQELTNFLKPNPHGVTPASQELFEERAVSPTEGEVAPGNSWNNVGSACEPSTSGNDVLALSPKLTGSSSMSTEVHISSELAPVHKTLIKQDAILKREEYNKMFVSNKRVLEWFSKDYNNDMSTNSSELSMQYEQRGGKLRNTSPDAGKESSMKDKMQPSRTEFVCNRLINSPANSARVKPCITSCVLKVYIKSHFTEHVENLEVFRSNCEPRSKSHPNELPETSRNSQVSFVVEVIERPDSLEDDLTSNMERGDNQERASLAKFTKRIPVKAQVQYGKLGWEELKLECLLEEDRGYRDSSVGTSGLERTMHNIPTIEKVVAKLCNCSRSLQVECYVSNRERGLGNNFVIRSSFSASLEDFQCHWGLPDNPVTLSASTHFEVSNLYVKNLLNNNVPSLISHIGGEVLMLDSSEQTLENMSHSILRADESDSTNISMGENETGGTRQVNKQRGPMETTHSRFVQVESVGSSPGHSDDTYISESSPSLAWMTKDKESSKQYTVDQWKNLMQEVRSGGQSSRSSSPSSSDFNSAVSSISSIGQESYDSHKGRLAYS